MKFSPHVEKVPFPPISEVKGWVADCTFSAERPLVDLCQAIPDYPPAPELLDFLREKVGDPAVARYSVDEGLPEVRSAVCAWYERRYGAGPSVDELCLTIGASQAFWLAIMTLCRAGDEVILPAPAYFDHPMALQALGVRCVWVPFREETAGLPTIAEIEARITSRTRAVLLVSPCNPTGGVIPAEHLLELYRLVRKHDLVLIVDETYHAFLPGEILPHRLFQEDRWQENFVHLASFGKTFSLTGYRAGALVAGSQMIHQALKVQDSMAVCQPCLTQHAVAFGCEFLDDWVRQKNSMMQRRHELFVALFNVPENPFQLIASGGFFAWIKHPWPDISSRAAAQRMVAEGAVACLPGEVFGPDLNGYLRLAFGNLPEAKMAAAVTRFLALSY